ncbi:hypothetical protein BD769DRAFT_1673775 [Suillus cothurnatus]|nr:hypothetical protein BD769DRAFT_1673775 [Suillus cothurnatus]
MLLAWRRFNPESDTPVYHLSDLPDLPNPTALLSNLIERDISPTAIIANHVLASWLNSEGWAEFLGSHVPDPLEGILEVKFVVRLALAENKQVQQMGLVGHTDEDAMNIDKDEPQITDMGEMDVVALNDKDAMNINEHELEITDMGEMDVVTLNDEDVMNIDEDEPQITDMGEMDIVTLNDEDTMNIDKHEPKITDMGEMDVVALNDEDAMNINEDEFRINNMGEMDVVGLNDDNVMNDIDEHEHNQMEDMHGIGLNDDAMNVYESEDKQIMTGAIFVIGIDDKLNHMNIDEDGLDIITALSLLIHFPYPFRTSSSPQPFDTSMSISEHDLSNPQPPDVSLCLQTSPHARAKRKIATLMEDIEILKQDKVTKHRKMTYYVSQGRAIRHMVILYTPIEDLITENDRRCEERDGSSTTEEDHLQCGYIELAKVLPWLHETLARLDHEESEDMLKKHHRGFVSDACGKLLCPAEWCWDDPLIRAGIHDHTAAFIVSENLWLSFMYENYTADTKNLERGLMKSKLLVMGFKAIFTSPSSANEVDREGDGTDILENNQHTQRRSDQAKVKTCVASIIGMRKVTPHSIAYTACQVRFALSCITSWRTVDGDFNYQLFWNNIVDFFEDAPGPAAQVRLDRLLEWWTRKVFGRNHRQDLTLDVISKMLVNVLTAQRQQMEDATFDSD